MRNLKRAVQRLGTFAEDLKVSSIYETQPLYVEDQPRFLNIAAGLFTHLPPLILLHRLQAIESEMGRDRSSQVPKGPRPLDIDILLYEDRVINHPHLSIPHPGITERGFVLIPLLELDPSLRNPLNGRLYSPLLSRLRSQGVYTFSSWDYTGGPTN